MNTKEEIKNFPIAAWLIIIAFIAAILFSGCKKETIEPIAPPSGGGTGPGPIPTELYNDYRIEFEIFDNGIPSNLAGMASIIDSSLVYGNGVNHVYEPISSGHLYEEILLNDVPDSINVYATYHLCGMFYAGAWTVDINDQLSIKIYRNDTLVHTEFGFDIGDSNPIWLNN